MVYVRDRKRRASLNTVCLSGRIASDPAADMKCNGDGMCCLTISLAVNRDRAKPDAKQKTDFISVVIYGKTAEFVGQYLDKGALVEITGRVQIRQYESQGQPRTSFEVLADSVQALESKEAAELRRAKSGKPAPVTNPEG